MTPDLIKLTIIFLVIIVLIWRYKGLDIAMLGGTVAGLLLYFVSPQTSLALVIRGITSKSTIEMVLAFYLITFLQRVLEKRGRLILAEESISQLFQSKRINAMLVPFIIGFLPSAGAVILAAPIVRNATRGSLSVEEQTFVASYYRHISEAFMPTYTTLILAMQLANASMGRFVLAMLPLVVILFFLGYLFYVRKVSNEVLPAHLPKSVLLFHFFQGMWPIILTVAVIMIFELPVPLVVLGVILLQLIIERVTLDELREFTISAFEKKLIIMTVMVMIFKEVLEHTGAIDRMAQAMLDLPVSPVMIYGLIFFVASIMIGARGAVAIFIPMAYASLPDGGTPLMVLLMSLSYIAMQISPTHICLGVVVNEFKVSMADLIKKTLPIMLVFILLTILYYQLLIQF